ncbi:hypothetical protein RN001_006049 [Aquatica leii]|uniref:Uncharacterized protein n=1 Tax=Aquatica leii TaxID=1421715 RepID=A0AAN7P7C6_9COLE|nr:hypothetical protein RN001_006049 [Aquatica leii]
MSQDLSDLSDLSDTEMVEFFSDERDSDFEVSTAPSLFSQDALSDLIRDLDLSKERSELLASRLKEKHLLSQGTKITCYRDREKVNKVGTLNFHAICLWDSRAKKDHWLKKDWPLRNNMSVGKQNIINPPLVSRDKIILPPLHIKLGFMKQYVKALNKTGPCFEYLSRKFPGLSKEKLKAGIFDGSQIRLLMKDNNFIHSMNDLEAADWKSFLLW